MILTFDILKSNVPTILVKPENSARYESAISEATRWLENEVLSPDLMTSIEADSELKKIAESVLSFKAYLIAIPSLDLKETERGFAVIQDDNNNIVPASKERVQALKESMVKRIHESLDKLLGALEQKTDLHGEWAKTRSYSLIPNFYISSIDMFRRYGNFEGNRLNFIGAIPTLKGIAVRVIEKWITQAYAAVLLGGKDAEIMELVRYAIVALYNEDKETADAYLDKVRRMMLKSPDPAFAATELYATLTRKQEHNKIIGVFV